MNKCSIIPFLNHICSVNLVGSIYYGKLILRNYNEYYLLSTTKDIKLNIKYIKSSDIEIIK